MNPIDRVEFEKLKNEVQMLRRELEERKRQQIQMPLDEASIQALLQALYNKRIDRLTIKDLRYVTSTAVSWHFVYQQMSAVYLSQTVLM